MYVKNNNEHNCVSPVACLMYKGGDSMEIKTEADNDITERSHDDKPSTGMFAVSHDNILCSQLSVYLVCFHL